MQNGTLQLEDRVDCGVIQNVRTLLKEKGVPKKVYENVQGEGGFQGAYARSCNFYKANTHKASQVNEIVH